MKLLASRATRETVKATLIEQLIARFTAEGLKVSLVNVDFDNVGAGRRGVLERRGFDR